MLARPRGEALRRLPSAIRTRYDRRVARLLVEIDEELKRDLKVRLLREGETLKEWIARMAQSYVEGEIPSAYVAETRRRTREPQSGFVPKPPAAAPEPPPATKPSPATEPPAATAAPTTKKKDDIFFFD